MNPVPVPSSDGGDFDRLTWAAFIRLELMGPIVELAGRSELQPAIVNEILSPTFARRCM